MSLATTSSLLWCPLVVPGQPLNSLFYHCQNRIDERGLDIVLVDVDEVAFVAVLAMTKQVRIAQIISPTTDILRDRRQLVHSYSCRIANFSQVNPALEFLMECPQVLLHPRVAMCKFLFKGRRPLLVAMVVWWPVLVLLLLLLLPGVSIPSTTTTATITTAALARHQGRGTCKIASIIHDEVSSSIGAAAFSKPITVPAPPGVWDIVV